MARAPPRTLGGVSLRGADAVAVTNSGPRLLPALVTFGALVLAVFYGIPLTTTGDPLWFVPTRTEAERIDLYREGARVSIGRSDPRYRSFMDALNSAFDSPTGIELDYGLRASDVEALRSRGRALEAVYANETRAHGRYALGPFTRVLVPFDGTEYERGLVFVGDERGYRAGPIRSPASAGRLRELAAGIP